MIRHLNVRRYGFYEDKVYQCSQQFHQYQQNEQLPLISNNWSQKTTMTLTIQVLSSDSHKNEAGLNRILIETAR
jgi:hypothetical protein